MCFMAWNIVYLSKCSLWTWEECVFYYYWMEYPEYSLEELMLKLKLQYFGHLMERADSLEKTDAGKDWRQEEKGMTGWNGWMASLTQWTWVWTTSGRWWRTRKPGMLQSMGKKRVRHDWATEQQGFYNCHLDPADWWCCSIQLNPYWFSACWVCQLLIE